MTSWPPRDVQIVAPTGAFSKSVGRYFADCKLKRSSKHSYDEAVGALLWQVSADLVGLTVDG